MTFISRILGFVRDMLTAQIFGVNAQMDAFLIAFKLPNFMRALFAEGSFSQAFVPTLSYYRTSKNFTDIRLFIAHVAGCLGLILLIIIIISMIFMPVLVKLSAPGFDHSRFELAVYLCRITFPYLMLISLTAFISAILNSYRKFGIAAITPALLNICLIIAALAGKYFFKIPIESLAWGVLMAGVVQLVFQLPTLKKLGLLTCPKVCFQDPGVKKILTLMLPAIFGASVIQIGVLMNSVLASFLPKGSITWLYYSERLAYFPQGVFGVALATVILPHLSHQVAQKSVQGFRQSMDMGIRMNLLLGMPASIVMGVLSGPLVTTLFQYGHFTLQDVLMTQKSVIAYSVGLQAFMLIKVLSTGFYAQSDVKTPVKIGIVALLLNIVMSLLLMLYLQHAGLALATSCSAVFNSLLLIYFLYKKAIFRFQSGWCIFLVKLCIANSLVFIWLYFMRGDISDWLHWRVAIRMFHLSLLLLMAGAIYLASLWLTGLKNSILAV